jgi:hypothetical protein
MIEGFAVSGREEDGAIPRRNPTVTIAAAEMTRNEGLEWVCIEETAIVSGKTRPLAI